MPALPHHLHAMRAGGPAGCQLARPPGRPAWQQPLALQLPLPPHAAPWLPAVLPALGGHRRLGATCSGIGKRFLACLRRGSEHPAAMGSAPRHGHLHTQPCSLP